MKGDRILELLDLAICHLEELGRLYEAQWQWLEANCSRNPEVHKS